MSLNFLDSFYTHLRALRGLGTGDTRGNMKDKAPASWILQSSGKGRERHGIWKKEEPRAGHTSSMPLQTRIRTPGSILDEVERHWKILNREVNWPANLCSRFHQLWGRKKKKISPAVARRTLFSIIFKCWNYSFFEAQFNNQLNGAVPENYRSLLLIIPQNLTVLMLVWLFLVSCM